MISAKLVTFGNSLPKLIGIRFLGISKKLGYYVFLFLKIEKKKKKNDRFSLTNFIFLFYLFYLLLLYKITDEMIKLPKKNQKFLTIFFSLKKKRKSFESLKDFIR